MSDHVFAPNSWTIREVRIGGEDPWRTRSDHAPMLADVVPN
jgi:endonuclease/exonuclease/phosphatase family metal-dependent hydrolase